MFVLNMGRKDLKEAFTLYRCDFCGFEGIQAEVSARPFGHPDYVNQEVNFTEDIYEGPIVDSYLGFTKIICPNCAKGMGKIKFKTNKEYAETITGKVVQIIKSNNQVEDYCIDDNDLYVEK